MRKQDRKYYDILTTEGATEATILLYGYIGEYYDWATDEMKGVTDVAFVQELERLAATYPTIHVRINSPGGEIFHGSAIVTAIRNCPSEVHTWIDGVAASMAGVIWMAGKKRHMAKNGMLMIHSASGLCWGNANDMRELAETLDQFDKTLVIASADSTGMSEEEMKKKYFDYKDHWLTWNDVNAEGWLSEEEEYQAAGKMPEDIARMSYRDLVAYFEKEKHPEGQGLLQQLRSIWNNTIAAVTGSPASTPVQAEQSPILSQTEIQEMTLKDFQDSLAAGTLKLEDVQAHLATLSPADASAKDGAPAPNQEIETIKAEVQKLTEVVAAFGQQPGAGKSAPGMPADDLPTNDGKMTDAARLEKMNKALAEAADQYSPVKFVPAS